MTDRQYNSKLLGDKLSQLPAPPNEALWSRLEAQLLVVPPVAQQPPAKTLPKPAKTVLIKTTIAIVSGILLTIFILWLVSRKAPQPGPGPAPAVQPAPQPAVMDSTGPDTALPLPAKPVSIKNPWVKPAPQSLDTATFDAPLLPRRSTVEVPLRDSVPSLTVPAAAAVRADSVKLPPKKKDEGYYFEVKKKG